MPTQKSSPSSSSLKLKRENVPSGRSFRGLTSRLSSGKFSKREALTAAAGLVVIAAVVIVFVSAAGLRKRINLSFQGTAGNVIRNSDGSLAFNSTTPGTPNTATGKFYIVGKQIVDPDGNVFRPMGANVALRQAPYLENNYIFNYFGTANDKSEQVKAWGWNTIRPNINCASTSNPSTTETLAGLDQLVNEYTAKKMVVMVTCRVVVGEDHPYTNGEIQASLPMIKTIAQKYKNNPYVWMNPFNEPTANQSGWINLNTKLYNDVRAAAPDMIYSPDLAGLGNQIETLVDGNLAADFGAGKCNILYDWHAYGFINGNYATEAQLQQYMIRLSEKKIAMIVGEFGDPLLQNGEPFMVRVDPKTDGIAGSPTQNRIAANAVLKYAAQLGYGMTWWIATGDQNNKITYSLTKDMTSPWTVTQANAATKLAPAGKLFWDVSHQSHNLGKFTGNIRDSGCASAQ